MPIFIQGGGGGVNLSVVTADVGDALSGKIFVNAEGRPKTGTMANNGTVSTDIITKAQEVTIAQGYHSGDGIIKIASAEQAKIIETNILGNMSILGVLGTAYNWIFATGSLTLDRYYATIPVTNMSAIGMVLMYCASPAGLGVNVQLGIAVPPTTSGILYGNSNSNGAWENTSGVGIGVSVGGDWRFNGTYTYYVLGVA